MISFSVLITITILFCFNYCSTSYKSEYLFLVINKYYILSEYFKDNKNLKTVICNYGFHRRYISWSPPRGTLNHDFREYLLLWNDSLLEYAMLLDMGRQFFYNGRDCHTAWRLLTAPCCYQFWSIYSY